MKYSKIIIALVAVCILGALIFFVANRGKNSSNPLQESVQSSPSKSDEQENTTQGNTPKPAPVIDPALKITEKSDVSEKIHEILMSANEFYGDIKGNTLVITQNGFMYNAPADIVVTPEYLVTREYLSADYLLDGAVILLLTPEDVLEVIPSIEDYSNELEVYAAAPYEGGYIFDSKGWGAIKISNDDFGKLLETYNVKHGEPQRITGSSKEYPEINALLKDDKQVSSDFYIRYGMRNDKYAVVIVSPKDDYSNIYQYVLAMDNGEWKIRIPNLEAVEKTRAVANNVCRDLDNELMPNYDIKSFSGFMMKDFTGVSEKLITDGYLSEEDAVIKYISATDKYMFAKYENGQMFVGVNPDGNIWILGEVDSPENAYNRFKGMDERAPDFVIIWE